MMGITVVSKQPPGGRCTLYLRYAEALARLCGWASEVVYPGERLRYPPPPALLLRGRLVEPSDGVILSPEDICAATQAVGYDGDVEGLCAALQREQDQLMEEWANGS